MMKSPLGMDGVNYDKTICFTKEQMAKVLKEGGFQEVKAEVRRLEKAVTNA